MKISVLFKSICKDYPIKLLLFSLILIVTGLIEATGLFFLAPIFDIILENDLENSSAVTKKIYLILNQINIVPNLELLFFIFIASTILTALSSTLCVYFSEKIKYSYGYDLMSSTLKNLFSIKWIFFTKIKQGSLLNTLNRELTVIINTLSIFARMISNIVQFSIIAILPFTISWQLVSIMVFTLLIIFSPLLILTKYARKVGDRDTVAHREFLNAIQETFSGLKVIIGNSLQNVSQQNILLKFIVQIRVAIVRAVLFVGISNTVLPITAIGFGVLYYSSYHILDIKIVEITVVAAAFIRMTSKIGQILREKASLEAALASLKELSLINNTNKKLLVKNGNKDFKKLYENIKFKNVNYSYDKKNVVLTNCNLLFENKKITAITGESGGGKSTLIDLLMGFDFPSKGNIEIDNINIKNLNLNNYRKKIGYVSQDSILFNTTILKNILWTNSKAKKNDVEKIISDSKAFNFIKKLPNGLNTRVGDRGLSLSGGQIQRIALLRALIKNPELIILDEATSALDDKNEKYIIDYLHKLKKTTTIILIAHRLSSLKNIDMLYIINKGKVVESGSYKFLKKKKKSIFLKLLNVQKNK